MQVILIVSAIVVFLATLTLSIVRASKLGEIAKTIYDPKLRITTRKSFSVWILALICIASLVSIIWLFGFYGILFNYQGGFALKPAINWQLVENDFVGSEQSYVYKHINGNNIRIVVNHLDKEETEAKKAEIRQTRKNLTSSFREERKQFRADAKSTIIEMRTNSKKAIKELRATFRKDKQQRNIAINANKEQLEIGVKKVEAELKHNLATNKENIGNVLRNGWLQRNYSMHTYTALQHGRLYTASVISRDNLSDISISPSGFFIGVFNGCIFPCTVFLAINNSSLHPYKEINNGFSYILGFILGLLIFLMFTVWLIYIPLSNCNRKIWKKKWLVMTANEKVAYITILYNTEQEINNNNLEEIKQESKELYSDFKEEYGMTPNQKLKELNAPQAEKGVLDKIAHVFTAGGHSRGIAEKQYNSMKMVYDCFDSECEIAYANVEIASTRYNFICRKAVCYVQEMKELISSFTYEQKKEFDQTERMDLKTIEFDGQKVAMLLESIESFNKDYNLRTKSMWNDTLNYAGFISNVSSLGSLGPALGLASIAVAGAVHYFGSINTNNEIKARLIEGRAEIRKAITDSKKNKSEAEKFVIRADEICEYLDESMKRYITLFAEISARLFPDGDSSKSKAQRNEHEKNGKTYYSDEERMLIGPLGKYAKAMAKVIDADF